GDLDLVAVCGGESRLEAGAGDATEGDADVPVLLGHEGLDLALPVDDETEGDRRHPPGGETERELRLDQGGDVVAGAPIEHLASALGVVEVLAELAGVVHPVLDARSRDLGELAPGDLGLGALDLLGDVKGDRLALA